MNSFAERIGWEMNMDTDIRELSNVKYLWSSGEAYGVRNPIPRVRFSSSIISGIFPKTCSPFWTNSVRSALIGAEVMCKNA
jgi:hypothetical protein